jgi:drug/metabolite transporter (DMT)-like permease
MYSFLWDGHWPTAPQFIACALFTLGVVASIRAHR